VAGIPQHCVSEGCIALKVLSDRWEVGRAGVASRLRLRDPPQSRYACQLLPLCGTSELAGEQFLRTSGWRAVLLGCAATNDLRTTKNDSRAAGDGKVCVVGLSPES
jgi:hypothetical protein